MRETGTCAFDGRRLRDELLAELRGRLAAAGHPPVTLATVLVGADGPGRRAMAAKHAAAASVGIGVVAIDLSATATQDEVESALASLAADATIDAIFVQLPLPGHLDTARIIGIVPPALDVDGMTPGGPFAPASARAVLRLLERDGVETTGRRVVIVGDAPFVAAPLADLMAEDALVQRIDAAAPDLSTACRRADLVVDATATGGAVAPADLRAGTVVFDATAPGGVGPATIAVLLETTVLAAGVGR